MSESLDPRINRAGLVAKSTEHISEPLDQLPTFEVFVQPKEGRPFQHEGIVHATDNEMAFVFAKEQYSRRNTCSGILTVSTADVYVSPYTDNQNSIYNQIPDPQSDDSGDKEYLVFHLLKRGKQHKLIGSVLAKDHDSAARLAKGEFGDGKAILNLWIIDSECVFSNEPDDQAIWGTLHEKKFRDAIAYRGADKITKFKEENL